MAITANMTTSEGIALTNAYCIVRNAEVVNNDDNDNTFTLKYTVQVYASSSKRGEELEKNNRIINKNFNNLSTTYDVTSSSNLFALAYADLKTKTSVMSNIADA